MNNAEHIHCQVEWLADEDMITRAQLVRIVQTLVQPFISSGEHEPAHFAQANDQIHRLITVRDNGPPKPDEGQ